MQKKLMILFIFAVFVLVLGWANTPAQAHIGNPCPHNNPDHKHCTGGGGGEGFGDKIRLCVFFTDDSAITSDGRGAYCADDSGNSDVVPVLLKGSGGLFFSIPKKSTRSIDLDFSDFAMDCDDGKDKIDPNSDCANRTFPDFVTPAIAFFSTREQGQNEVKEILDFRTLPIPSMTPVALFLAFNLDDEANNITRNIIYGGGLFPPGDECITGDPALVTRLTNGCWMLSSPVSEKGCLTKKTGGKNAEIELQGTYHMPFLMMLEDRRAEDPISDILGCPVPSAP